VTEELESKVRELAEAIVDAIDALDNALEEKSRVRINTAHDKVERADQLYTAVLALADGMDRTQIEQRHGRKVTDMKRQVSRMPRGADGRPVQLSAQAGQVPFIEQRAPGKSIQEISGPPRSRHDTKPKYTTGGEVEAWCGPCGGMRTHNIYALVDGEPQQVICQACGARHGFRTTPARKTQPDLAVAGGGASSRNRNSLTREQMEEEKRNKAREQLREELAAATQVRAFSPKERYKAGEIIEHPELGRGKIENVTRGSVLVRFTQGLRPLDLH
jgi:hypothetical protein